MAIPYFFSKKKTPIRTFTLFKTEDIKEDFSSYSPPSIFIGSKLKYPNVNVGVLSPPKHVEDSWVYDAPLYWVQENYSIKQILNLRQSLINSRFQTQVKTNNTQNKFLETSQEIGMSYKPIDVEISLIKKPKLKLDYDSITSPITQAAPLKKLKITENPKIPTKVDKVVSDTDLKANEALNYLYKNNIDEHYLTQLLSIGVLGIKKNRRLVPTRWSITATDDSLGKHIIEEILDYPTIDENRLYYGNYLGNYYLIMLFPSLLEYELFEMYLPHSSWNPTNEIKVTTDYEYFWGRKVYAKNTVGGYYASRLAVLELFKKIKKQASCLVIRFETPSYWAGLGVWVVRNAARKTLNTQPYIFGDKEIMLNKVKEFVKEKFRYDLSSIFKNSKLLNNVKTQTKLTTFL